MRRVIPPVIPSQDWVLFDGCTVTRLPVSLLMGCLRGGHFCSEGNRNWTVLVTVLVDWARWWWEVQWDVEGKSSLSGYPWFLSLVPGPEGVRSPILQGQLAAAGLAPSPSVYYPEWM